MSDTLPAVAAQLLDLLGQPDFDLLIGSAGGSCLRVPMRDSEPPQRIRISRAGWRALQAVYRGDAVYIPNLKLHRIREQHEQIKALRSQGVPLHTLAQRFGLTTRGIMRITSGLKDPSQVDLPFEDGQQTELFS
jgi:hypothetical protein